MIDAKNLKRCYGDFVAVDDVSFTINKGEIVGLLGHNGAGKTTIMKMLTGYLEPTAGQVLLDGKEVTSNRLEVQSRIGYLPESSPLYPEMTVAQYLEYVADLRSIPGAERGKKLTSALERTGLRDKVNQIIDTLSKGYKQRVGVAQAILHQPDILVLDEPTNGLDPSQIHEMRSLIRLLSENSTVLLSTHILQEVEATCDRVIIILQGAVVTDARLEDLRRAERLLVKTDQTSNALAEAVRGLEGVARVEAANGAGPGGSCAIQIDRALEEVAPRVAKTIVDKGWQLLMLEPDRRSLESIFREVSVIKGGVDEQSN